MSLFSKGGQVGVCAARHGHVGVCTVKEGHVGVSKCRKS